MLDDLAGTAGRISAAVQSVIEGKAGVVRLVLTVLLNGPRGTRHCSRSPPPGPGSPSTSARPTASSRSFAWYAGPAEPMPQPPGVQSPRTSGLGL
jgi:hypothetical protein